MKTSTRRFTLLELLVVISVITMLMTLLLPSLGQARISSMKAVCKSNMSQVHKLQMIYSSNNNHHLTMSESGVGGSYSWDDFLNQYDGRKLPDSKIRLQGLGSKEDFSFQVYTCPLAKKRHESEPSRNFAMNKGWFRNNGHINGIAWSEGSVHLAEVEDPSTMMFYEMDDYRLRLSRVALGNNADAFFRGSWRNWSDHHGKLYMINVLEVNGSVKEQNLNNPAIWSRDLD
jgi:competence protein ComGC